VTIEIPTMQDQLKDWLNQYYFQAFVTLTLKDDRIPNHDLEDKILNWVRKAQRADRIQLAYQGVINSAGRKHVHLLMVGKDRRGNTIKDTFYPLWFDNWNGLTDFQLVYYNEGIIGYIVDMNTPCQRFQLLTPYNTKLLRRSMI